MVPMATNGAIFTIGTIGTICAIGTIVANSYLLAPLASIVTIAKMVTMTKMIIHWRSSGTDGIMSTINTLVVLLDYHHCRQWHHSSPLATLPLYGDPDDHIAITWIHLCPLNGARRWRQRRPQLVPYCHSLVPMAPMVLSNSIWHFCLNFLLKFNRVQYQLILIYITWDKETYLFTIFPLALNYELQAIDHLTNESKNWDDIILLTCKLIVPLPTSIMWCLIVLTSNSGKSIT